MGLRLQKSIIIFLFTLCTVGIIYNLSNSPLNTFKSNCISAQKSIETFQRDFIKFASNESLIDRIVKNNIDSKQIQQLSNEYYFQYIYKGDELIFWNKNSVIPETHYSNIKKNGSLLLKKNGYYIAFTQKNGDYNIVGMMLIKHNYSIVNKYLNNTFSDRFDFKEDITIELPSYQGGTPIKNLQNETIFKVVFNDSNLNKPLKQEIYIAYLTILSFWVLAIFSFEYVKKQINLKSAFVLLFAFSAIFIFIINFVDLKFKKTIFFSPELYASQFYGNSLGDLTSYALIILIVGISISTSYYRKKWDFNKVTYYLYTILTFFIFFIYNNVVRSLILDSVISFEINNFTLSNVYTFVGIIIIIFLSIIAFLYLYVWTHATKNQFTKGSYLIILSFFLLEAITLYFLNKNYATIISSIIACLILIVFNYLLKNRIYFNKFNFVITSTILFSLLISTLLILYNIEAVDIRKSNIANQLSENRDRIAEFKFEEIQKEIKEDPFFKKFFISPFISQRELQQRLNYIYFGGYMSKYNVNSIAFNIEGKAIKTTDTLTIQHYYDIVNKKAKDTTSEWLFLIPKIGGKNNYLSILPIENNGTISGTLVLELTEKTYQKENLYPELLIEQKTSKIAQYGNENDYESAIYSNNYLVAQSGEYPFPYYLGTFDIELNREYPFSNVENGFRLNFFEIDEQTKVVISTPKISPLIPISTFSYIYCFIIILSILAYLIIRLININETIIPITPIRLTFKNRINLAILSISISSFIIIGIVTIGYFTELYKVNNTDKLIKKQKSVLSSIEYLLNKQNTTTLEQLPSNISTEIASIAEIHGIDINIFNTTGEIVFSSQPSIFGNGLISKKMDPVAKYNLVKLNSERFIQNESINKLQYVSIYVPVRIKTGKAVGVLNLPYFAQEETLRKELSKFMVALVNVYVLLLIISTFIAFLISNSITSPLANISNKLSLINLGKKNESIEWIADDEIGALVKEYNKMIKQIEESAQTLAKSERESAWREMARQIAHEIKNPLTPMKLSIQHLQRALKDNPDNAIPLADKVSKTMVEQIDNLSEIATAFSSFAQMPTANKENVDLIEILQNVVDLFNQNNETQIFFTPTIKNAFVYSDKNQLLSVFNNLIKNAQQATEEKDDAWVKIRIEEKEGKFITSIKDNGEGIPDDRKEKLFVPNFTTKSSGTGLGLAISKQIIVNNNGHIWFQSIENEGATFYVSLPKYKNNQNDVQG